MANGHRFSDLGHYTARQLLLFYRQSHLRERAGRAARTLDVAVGVNGGKEIKQYINELTA